VRTDDALLAAARGGDDAAFTDLYRRHAGAARRYAARRCRGAGADDAVAVAFASVFRAVLNGGGPNEDFKSYLLAAVRNAIVDQIRRRGRLSEVDVESIDAEAAAWDVPEHSPVGTHMGAALDALPDRQRQALWDTEVEGHSNDEMARRLELSVNAFAALKKRARRNLADAYATQVAGGDVCVWVGDRIDAYIAAELLRGDQLVIDLHVEQCAACAAFLPERSRTKVGLLALPLLLAAPLGIGHGRKAAAAPWASATRRLAAIVPRSAAAIVGVAIISGAALVVTLDDAPAASTPNAASSPAAPSADVQPSTPADAGRSEATTSPWASGDLSVDALVTGTSEATAGGADSHGAVDTGNTSLTTQFDTSSIVSTGATHAVGDVEPDKQSMPTSPVPVVMPSTTATAPVAPPAPPMTTGAPPATLAPLMTAVLVPSPTTTMLAPNYALPVTTAVPLVVLMPTTTTAAPRIVRAGP
jgi:RNA polymerase sigma factor (sigma-70 family)